MSHVHPRGRPPCPPKKRGKQRGEGVCVCLQQVGEPRPISVRDAKLAHDGGRHKPADDAPKVQYGDE